MAHDFLFTSESVSEGHPDKIADQISDAILDSILSSDIYAKVACETLVKTGFVLIAGELSTSAWVDTEKTARKIIDSIGYNTPDMGFDAKSCAILTTIGNQSPDIAQGVVRDNDAQQGAGDQGMMYGYATRETDVLMPAPITYAHRMMKRHAELRKSGKHHWLRPDAKCQVTFRYQNHQPIAIDTIVISTQHDENVSNTQIKEFTIEEIINPTIPAKWLTADTKFLINPTGRFVIGGPQGDCGLTGRKIMVDTYGGMARHGGGAFSGKDPSKVDRSAAYAGRYVAKNIVAAGIADKCEIQISYAIGVAQPTSISIETFGTGKIADDKIIQLIRQHFDLTPRGIIKQLDLLRPIYLDTASYGHFGRENPNFSWEKTDKAELLRENAKLTAAAVNNSKQGEPA